MAQEYVSVGFQSEKLELYYYTFLYLLVIRELAINNMLIVL